MLFRCGTGITGCVAKLHSVDRNQIKLLICYRIQRIDVLYRERYDASHATRTVSLDFHPHTRSFHNINCEVVYIGTLVQFFCRSFRLWGTSCTRELVLIFVCLKLKIIASGISWLRLSITFLFISLVGGWERPTATSGWGVSETGDTHSLGETERCRKGGGGTK